MWLPFLFFFISVRWRTSFLGHRLPELEETLVCADGSRAGVLHGWWTYRDRRLERVYD